MWKHLTWLLFLNLSWTGWERFWTSFAPSQTPSTLCPCNTGSDSFGSFPFCQRHNDKMIRRRSHSVMKCRCTPEKINSQLIWQINNALKYRQSTSVSELLLTLKRVSLRRDAIKSKSVTLFPPCPFLLLSIASSVMLIIYPFSVSSVWSNWSCCNKNVSDTLSSTSVSCFMTEQCDCFYTFIRPSIRPLSIICIHIFRKANKYTVTL